MGISIERPSGLKIIFAYLMVYIIWGSTYLAIRFTVETIPPFLSGGARFLAAGIALTVGRSIYLKRGIPTEGWKHAFLASLLPFVITYGLITNAETVVPSSIAALIIALEPLWFCIIGWLFFNGAKPIFRHYAGIFLGFVGIVLLVVCDPSADFSFDSAYLIWILALIVSGFTWVIGAFVSRNPRIHEDTLMSSGMQMICGGGTMMLLHFIVSSFTGAPAAGTFSSKSLIALLYLITFGSLVGYTSFLWLMRVEPANRVATHAFVNPVVAVFLGWLFGGEELSLSLLLATPMIVLSVVLMIWRPKERTS